MPTPRSPNVDKRSDERKQAEKIYLESKGSLKLVEIAEKLKSIDGINSVKVETTYSPVWKMTRISRYGRIALGILPRSGK